MLFWIEPIEKESASLLTAVKFKQKKCWGVVVLYVCSGTNTGASDLCRRIRAFSIRGILTRAEANAFLSLSLPAIITHLLSHIFYFCLSLIILRGFSSRLKADPMWWGGSSPSVLWLSLGSLERNQELQDGCSADWVPGRWIGRKLPNIDCQQASDIYKSWFASENSALILSVPIFCWIILFNKIIPDGRRLIRQNCMLAVRGKQER